MGLEKGLRSVSGVSPESRAGGFAPRLRLGVLRRGASWPVSDSSSHRQPERFPAAEISQVPFLTSLIGVEAAHEGEKVGVEDRRQQLGQTAPEEAVFMKCIPL